eukprot:3646281-Rhodomonas_salina.1
MAHTGASLFDALRGGVTFDRKRFGSEISRFEKPQPKTGEQAVPRSVDFFGDTRAVLPGSKQDGKAREKRKEAGGKDTRPAKKKKAKDEVEDEEEDDEEDEEGEEEVVDEEEDEAGGVRLFAESAVVADSEKKSKDKTGGQKKSALKRLRAGRKSRCSGSKCVSQSLVTRSATIRADGRAMSGGNADISAGGAGPSSGGILR